MKRKSTVSLLIDLESELLQKLDVVAQYDRRTRNEECVWMIRDWVRAFEEIEGEILVP